MIRYIKNSRNEARYEITGILIICSIPVGFIFLVQKYKIAQTFSVQQQAIT